MKILENNRIFVSSTCYDLIDLRAELFKFLEDIGLTPIMSDHNNSDFKIVQNSHSIETCLVNLESCDSVIFILSKRYGPKLGKLGFEDISATHLEYRKAINDKKRILFFVRDKLDADFNVYRKTKDTNALHWVDIKNIGLFDLITEQKDSLKNNWFRTFKDSLELKNRLEIDLKKEISDSRLQHLIKNGNIPLLVINNISCEAVSEGYSFPITISNVGSQSAIEPSIFLYKDKLSRDTINDILKLPSIISGKAVNTYLFIEKNKLHYNSESRFTIKIEYKNLYGDTLTDFSELFVKIDAMGRYLTSTSFIKKLLK